MIYYYLKNEHQCSYRVVTKEEYQKALIDAGYDKDYQKYFYDKNTKLLGLIQELEDL